MHDDDDTLSGQWPRQIDILAWRLCYCLFFAFERQLSEPQQSLHVDCIVLMTGRDVLDVAHLLLTDPVVHW